MKTSKFSKKKNDILKFVKKTDFDNKLKDVTSNKNELNELSKQVKAISTKGLTKYLMNQFSILNGTKQFSLGIFQNYLVFIPAEKYIKYIFSNTLKFFCQFYRDDLNGNITQSESLKYKIKTTGKAPTAGNTKDVEIAVPLKYLFNFWITLEMPLINYEINLILNWSEI